MSKSPKSGGLQLRGLPLNGRTAALRALLLVDQGMSAQQALAAVLDVPVARLDGVRHQGKPKAGHQSVHQGSRQQAGNGAGGCQQTGQDATLGSGSGGVPASAPSPESSNQPSGAGT